MGNWKIKTQPATEPVTLTEAKEHLNIPGAITEWDTLIQRQIKTARQYVEDYTTTHLITTHVLQYYSEFPCDWLELTRFPVQSITHIKYTNASGVLTEWSNSEYNQDKVSKVGRVAPKPAFDWPDNDDTINSIEIEYIVGFGAATTDVPEIYKDAILLTVGQLFENREDTVHALPTRVIDLLRRRANWEF